MNNEEIITAYNAIAQKRKLYGVCFIDRSAILKPVKFRVEYAKPKNDKYLWVYGEGYRGEVEISKVIKIIAKRKIKER
jgi:hypothetical protein